MPFPILKSRDFSCRSGCRADVSVSEEGVEVTITPTIQDAQR